jgi:hypothetical protein
MTRPHPSSPAPRGQRSGLRRVVRIRFAPPDVSELRAEALGHAPKRLPVGRAALGIDIVPTRGLRSWAGSWTRPVPRFRAWRGYQGELPGRVGRCGFSQRMARWNAIEPHPRAPDWTAASGSRTFRAPFRSRARSRLQRDGDGVWPGERRRHHPRTLFRHPRHGHRRRPGSQSHPSTSGRQQGEAGSRHRSTGMQQHQLGSEG